MSNITEDPPMSADIITFGPRQSSLEAEAHARADTGASPRRRNLGQLATAALIATLRGTLKLLRFTSYLALFALSRPIRGILGFISGLGFLSLIVVWLFVNKDWDHRNVGLIVSAVGLFGGAALRIIFDRLLPHDEAY